MPADSNVFLITKILGMNNCNGDIVLFHQTFLLLNDVAVARLLSHSVMLAAQLVKSIRIEGNPATGSGRVRIN